MKRINLDIKAKFGVVIAVVLGAVALCGWSGIHATNGLNTHVKTLYRANFGGMRTIADLNVQIGHVQDEATNYALAHDKGENDELHGRDPVIRKEIAQLAAAHGNSPKAKKLITQEAALWSRYMADWDGGKLAQKPGETAGDTAGTIDDRISPLKDNMEALAALANTNAGSGYDKAESLASSGNRLTLIMLVVAALLGLGGVAWLIKQIVPRVRRY